MNTIGSLGRSAWLIYSALDAELAVKEAKEVALDRGDTDFVQYITANIEVLLPEAVKYPRRITDPLEAILKELAQDKPVEIFNREQRFYVTNAVPFNSNEGRSILATLNCGLRVKLPLMADGRCARNWFINRSDSGILQIEIDWDFLDMEYLDI